MINIAVRAFCTSAFFKRKNLLPGAAGGRDVPAIKFLQGLLFGEFHPLPCGEVVVIEDELVGIVELADDLSGVLDAVVEKCAFCSAALHGEGVVEIDGDEVAAFFVGVVVGEVGAGECRDEGDDGEASQQQHDKVLHPRLSLGFLGHILQHLHIGEIVGLVPPEIKKMDQDGYQDGGVANEK